MVLPRLKPMSIWPWYIRQSKVVTNGWLELKMENKRTNLTFMIRRYCTCCDTLFREVGKFVFLVPVDESTGTGFWLGDWTNSRGQLRPGLVDLEAPAHLSFVVVRF